MITKWINLLSGDFNPFLSSFGAKTRLYLYKSKRILSEPRTVLIFVILSA